MSRERLKTALFGGSFDPPHTGHREIVKEALKLPDIEQVVVVPTYLNPFKTGSLLTPKERLELVEMTFSDMDRVVVSSFEIEQNRAVFTVETLEALSRDFQIEAIIIGADNLKSINKWRDFDKINSQFEWIVATRGSIELESIDILDSFRVIDVNVPISSTEIRQSGSFEFIDKKALSRFKDFYKNKERNLDLEERVDRVVKLLDSKKAEDIEVINLEGVDYIANEVIIANSMGGRHTQALFDHLKSELKPLGEEFYGADESDEWIVVDMGDIIVHIMTPAYRQKYSIEEFLSSLLRENNSQ